MSFSVFKTISTLNFHVEVVCPKCWVTDVGLLLQWLLFTMASPNKKLGNTMVLLSSWFLVNLMVYPMGSSPHQGETGGPSKTKWGFTCSRQVRVTLAVGVLPLDRRKERGGAWSSPMAPTGVAQSSQMRTSRTVLCKGWIGMGIPGGDKDQEARDFVMNLCNDQTLWLAPHNATFTIVCFYLPITVRWEREWVIISPAPSLVVRGRTIGSHDPNPDPCSPNSIQYHCWFSLPLNVAQPRGNQELIFLWDINVYQWSPICIHKPIFMIMERGRRGPKRKRGYIFPKDGSSNLAGKCLAPY